MAEVANRKFFPVVYSCNQGNQSVVRFLPTRAVKILFLRFSCKDTDLVLVVENIKTHRLCCDGDFFTLSRPLNLNSTFGSRKYMISSRKKIHRSLRCVNDHIL